MSILQALILAAMVMCLGIAVLILALSPKKNRRFALYWLAGALVAGAWGVSLIYPGVCT